MAFVDRFGEDQCLERPDVRCIRSCPAWSCIWLEEKKCEKCGEEGCPPDDCDSYPTCPKCGGGCYAGECENTDDEPEEEDHDL